MLPVQRKVSIAAIATVAALGATGVQAQTMTAQQFMDACRTNPANTVLLTQQTKLQSGVWAPFTTPTGCTVILGSGASFELDDTRLIFGGTFTVQGGQNGKVAVSKGAIEAPAVALNLTGTESEFQMDDARVIATTGNLSLQFGEKGKMEIKNSGGWYQPRLAARRGTFTFTAGAFFNGSMVQSGVQGAAGMNFNFNGFDSALKLEKTDLLVSSGATSPPPYVTGAFQVSSSATKVAFEAIDVNLMEASRTVNIALAGAESRIALSDFTSQTSSQRISIAANGTKGEVKIGTVLMYGIPEVIIESGAQGTTSVAGNPNTINSTQLIRIRAGLGGSCSANAQGLNASQILLCR